jgi:hypothetical protein
MQDGQVVSRDEMPPAARALAELLDAHRSHPVVRGIPSRIALCQMTGPDGQGPLPFYVLEFLAGPEAAYTWELPGPGWVLSAWRPATEQTVMDAAFFQGCRAIGTFDDVLAALAERLPPAAAEGRSWWPFGKSRRRG